MILKIQRPNTYGWHLFEVDHIEYYPISPFDCGVLEEQGAEFIMEHPPSKEDQASYSTSNPTEEAIPAIGMLAKVQHEDKTILVVFDTIAFLCNDCGQTIEKLTYYKVVKSGTVRRGVKQVANASAK